MSGVDSRRQQLQRLARRQLSETFSQRSADGEVRWTLAIYPNNAYAQEADMSLDDYADFVYRACHADKADPVAEWRKLSARQQQLVDWLAGKESVRVQGRMSI